MSFGLNEKLLIHIPAAPPDGWLEAVAALFPALEVRWEVAEFVGSGIVASADVLPAEAWEGVTMLCVYPPVSQTHMANVRFVQLVSAGSDLWLGQPSYLDPGIQFCSASGAHPPQIAEWVIGTWLAQEHHFQTYMAQTKVEDWNQRVQDKPITDSVGQRVGILGYGAIGRHVARLCQALGMEVFAYTRRERPNAESRKLRGYNVLGTGDPEGLIPSKWFHGQLKSVINGFLAQGLDMLVITVPLTPDTQNAIGREQFQIMGGKHTFLSNVSRGAIVDTNALVDALERGLIRGAALDVTEPEPLPRGHPLWKAPNIFITPHISWQSTHVLGRMAGILMQNLERLEKGMPLLNELDRTSDIKLPC